ncbi:MAG: pilus assembly protein [Lysobacterales bacterium]
MQSCPESSLRASRRPLVAVLAVLVAISSFCAQAVLPLPEVPLQSGSALPANIWFILDDSGSMDWDFMPDSVPAISTPNGFNFARQTFARNTVYYNPATTYQPWRRWDGGFFPVTLPTAAWSSTQLASGGTIDLTASDKFFYVPKAGATNLADGTQYWRYRLRTTGVIERRELTFASGSWAWRNPVSLASVTWTTPNGPVTRTFAQELQNYATWYSYARTRNKVAKGGASAAFSGLGEDVRVGFSTIWNRSTFNIPVTSDSGLFRDQGGSTNRSTWFSRLHTATASGSTPLRNALKAAGTYFSRTDASGPYGPEPTSQQLACRQNFTILTTDGFWNGPSPGMPNVDGTAGATITGPNNPPFQYSPANPYKDTRADTLADVGMNNWIRDLRPDLPNIVPTSAADPAFWQHAVTFGISIGLRGTLNPETDLPALTTGALSWPPPSASSINNIDDLWHAAVNGRGEFVAATDPQAFSDGLKDALATITSRVGSSSNAATNSATISSNTQIFLASFIGGQWTGELTALPVTASGAGATPNWLASNGIPTPAARNIFTWDSSAGPSGDGASFPTTAQTTALGGPPVVAYLRGDRSGEQQNGGSFRDRLSLLGDIVDSSPVFVAGATSGTQDTIYFGANDGYLHAVNANNGAERFAYAPGGLNLNNLKKLTDPDYPHRYFVDGPLVVSTDVSTPAKRILVGTLGRGGRGIFALDVTDPTTFNATKVLWDRSTDADMGNVLGRPFIAKLNNGKTGVVVANGPNGATDHAVLFIFDVNDGSLIKKLDTGFGGPTQVNGLSAPRGLDTDLDGDIDIVYAGDLQGNVWKFDLSGNAAGPWKVANSGQPLYVAMDPLGNRQPITGRMTFGRNPVDFERWIFFGTGRFLTNGDPADKSVQTWYGMLDPTEVVPAITIPSVVNRSAVSNLLKTRKVAVIDTINGTVVRGFETPVPGDMAGKKGWLLDLLNPTSYTPQGERMVGDPFLFGEAVVAPTIIPNNDPCEVGGSGFVNALDAFTGATLPSSLFDVDGNLAFDDTVPGGGTPVGSFSPGAGLPANPVVVGVSGSPRCGVLGQPACTCGNPGQPACACGTPGQPACPCNPALGPCPCPEGTNLGLVPGSNGGVPRSLCVAEQSGQGRISWREIIRD